MKRIACLAFVTSLMVGCGDAPAPAKPADTGAVTNPMPADYAEKMKSGMGGAAHDAAAAAGDAAKAAGEAAGAAGDAAKTAAGDAAAAAGDAAKAAGDAASEAVKPK